MNENKSSSPHARKRRGIWAWIVGLLLIGFIGYTIKCKYRTPSQATEPTVILYLPTTSEVVGIAAGQECYRRKLDCSIVSYEVGANKLVAVGEDRLDGKKQPVVVLFDLMTGTTLTKKQLHIRLNHKLEGAVRSILVAPQEERAYIAGPSVEDHEKYRLAVFDSGHYDINYEPIDFSSQKIIAVDNDLGFFAWDTLYRFTKPPMLQLNGYVAPKEFVIRDLDFYYIAQTGLFTANRHTGMISRVADKSLQPLANPVGHPLAGIRLSSGMMAIDYDKKEIASVSWPEFSACTLQSFDLVRENVSWQRKIPGSVDQILCGASGKLYLLESNGKKIRSLESRQSELEDHTQLSDGYPNNMILLWGK